MVKPPTAVAPSGLPTRGVGGSNTEVSDKQQLWGSHFVMPAQNVHLDEITSNDQRSNVGLTTYLQPKPITDTRT